MSHSNFRTFERNSILLTDLNALLDTGFEFMDPFANFYQKNRFINELCRNLQTIETCNHLLGFTNKNKIIN